MAVTSPTTKHDFFALSRFDDVEKALIDWETYRSGRGSVLSGIAATSYGDGPEVAQR